MDFIHQRLKFFLAESMHKQTSGILRETIKDLFGVEYSKDDFSLIDCIFNQKDYPKIYTQSIYNESRHSLSELINKPQEKELKETSDLFTTYESSYPYDSILSLETLKNISNTTGRMRMYEGFFLWFSEYYNLYESSLNLLLSESEHDYIHVTWKYYLAIMAVSTIRCEYLLRDLEMLFLIKGGDERWLVNGLRETPEKLKKLEKINNILAHQPWKLKLQEVTEIFSKYDTKGWHANELVQAILILTNFQRLASVVEAFRLNFEWSGEDLKDEQKESKILKYITEENQNVKKIIISELEIINISEKTGKVEISHPKTHSRKGSEESLKLNSSFENLLSTSTKDFSKHISTYCTVYLDFDSHSEEFNSYIEFNWQDHGAYILRNYFPKGVDALNAEIDIGGDTKKLDTAQYRHTICTYVEKIYGYVNESFDYSKTNKLLHRTHKQFIKNIACFPQRINKTDVGVLKVTFSPEEIYHIILLVTAAKMRLQLTYFSKQLYEIFKNIE